MERNARIAITVCVAAVVAGSGVYVGYLLSSPGNPCSQYPTALKVAAGPVPLTISPNSTPRVLISGGTQPAPSAPDHPELVSPVINVVAAENFWGSLVSEIGGVHTSVTSIVSDPNTDPHEYQANDSTAKAIAGAQYVIVNNVGYDSWATQLIAADGDHNQTVLNVGDSVGVYVGGGIVSDNPHLWYNPTYVNDTVAWMVHNLTTIAPALSGYFTEQYDNLTASLGGLYSHVTQIRNLFHGTVVAATEDIFVYLANATDLDLVSPPAFMEAVAEGNDPSDSSVVQFECQLASGNVKVLVYNAQTVTPLTQSIKVLAAAHNVTTIFVTETVQPPGNSFQTWMLGELNDLQNALNANALGH